MGERAPRVLASTLTGLMLASVSGQAVSIGQPSQKGITDRVRLLDRFLEPDEMPLTSYRALRRLTASTRGGRLQAVVEAWTTLDPVRGFSFEIVREEGSALIRRNVLLAALEAEQKAARGPDGTEAALTRANYEFLGVSEDDELMRVQVRPYRRHHMRVEGSLLLEPDSADLVRVEGDLSLRPSIWTRRVHIQRDYGRINGVHVPLSMSSTADVRLVGASTFSMTYSYVEINGSPVAR